MKFNYRYLKKVYNVNLTKAMMLSTMLAFCFNITKAQPGNALDFDGNDDYVEAPDDNSIDQATFTLETWFKAKTSQPDSVAVLMNRQKNSQNPFETRNYWLVIDNSFDFSGSAPGAVSFRTGDGNNVNFTLSSSNSSNYDYRDNQWHHATVVVDDNNGNAELFIDGNSVHSLNFTSNTVWTGSAPLRLASPNNGSQDRRFSGTLDETRIWSETRSQQQIRGLMHQEINASNYSNLEAYYKFNASSGSTLTDNAGTNDGTLTNMDPNNDWISSNAVIGNTTVQDQNDLAAVYEAKTNSLASGELTASSSLSSKSNYAVFGHNDLEGETTSDEPSSSGYTDFQRLNRIWYMDETGTVSADLTFDLSGGSASPSTASNYVLLYRNGTSGNFTEEVNGASSISGSDVNFNGVALKDGYYTIGTKNRDASPLRVTTYYVDDNGNNADDGSQSTPWATIQHAVNNVAAGDVVQINAGTYTEQITITQDVTLEGADSSSAIIKSPSSLDTSFTYNGSIRKTIIHVKNGSKVNFQNLKLDGDNQNNNNKKFQGISFVDADGYIDRCAFVNMLPFSGQDGVPIFGDASNGTSRSIEVTNSNMRKFTKGAAAFFGSDLNVTFHNNTVLGHGPTTGTGQNGIQLNSVNYGSIKNNNIKDISHDDADVVGILCISVPDVDVFNNDIDEVKNPIFFNNASGTIANNDIDVSKSGLEDNFNIDDFQGIYLWGQSGSHSCTVDNNQITVNGPTFSSSTGLQHLVGYPSSGSLTVNATGNTIEGWNTGIHNWNFNNNGTLTLTYSSTTFNNNTMDIAGSGNANVSGSVMSDAIASKSAGGSVNIPPGNINETITIDKNLTITANENPTIQDLTINGNGIDVTVNDPLTIGNSMTLTDGIVSVPNSNDSIIFADDATVSGSSSSSYIEGKVTKIGDDAFTFPIGADGRYARIGISAPSSTTDEFSASFNNTSYTNTTNFAGSSGLNNVSSIEYWDLSRTNGSSSVNVTPYWADGSVSQISDLSDLRVAHWNGSEWENLGQDAITGDTTSGSITVNNVSSFSPFTFGSEISNENPLPVELVNFNAEKQHENVQLNWATASEKNASHFIVQHSGNGEFFESIGKVRAQGTTLRETNYRFMDERPSTMNYYRLKQVDHDGSFDYSKVISVAFNEAMQRDRIRLYGDASSNLVKGKVTIEQSGQYNINVRNSRGQMIHSESQSWKEGKHSFELNIDEVSKGMYYLEIVGNEQQFHKKVMMR